MSGCGVGPLRLYLLRDGIEQEEEKKGEYEMSTRLMSSYLCSWGDAKRPAGEGRAGAEEGWEGEE